MLKKTKSTLKYPKILKSTQKYSKVPKSTPNYPKVPKELKSTQKYPQELKSIKKYSKLPKSTQCIHVCACVALLQTTDHVNKSCRNIEMCILLSLSQGCVTFPNAVWTGVSNFSNCQTVLVSKISEQDFSGVVVTQKKKKKNQGEK